MSEPLVVDNSLLTSVACSTEAVLRHVHGLTTAEERAYLKAGTAGHATLARWFKGESKDAALTEFAESYQQWANENVRPDDRLSYANTSAIVGAWLDNHPLQGLPFRVLEDCVEVGFSFPLTDDGDIVFCGRMDAIVQSLNESTVWVLDHKFPGGINEAFVRQWKMDSQVDGYLWAAEQHLKQPVVGMYINAIQFSKLPSDPTRKCDRHATPYSECGFLHTKSELLITQRSPEQLEEWRKTAISIARRYQQLLHTYPQLEHLHKVRMQGKFFRRCAFCHFYDFCSVGRPLNLIHSMLVEERWEPYASAFSGVNTAHKP